MNYANTVAALEHYKKLSASTLRTDAPHPDGCPKLKIRRVMWAIPARGQRVAPQFDDEGNVTGVTAETADSWPEIEALQEAIKLPDDVVCPTCGQATGTTAALAEGAITAAFTLAVRALRAHYSLTPEQLIDLLSYEDTVVPEWFNPLLRWASGLPAEAPEAAMTPDLDGLMDYFAPQEPVADKPPWYQFWRRRA